MIENHRTGLLWDLFMSNPEIQPALDSIGFVPEASAVSADLALPVEVVVYPNPNNGQFNLLLDASESFTAQIQLTDALGRQLRNWGAFYIQNGENNLSFDTNELPAGVYQLWLTSGARRHTQRILVFHN